MTGHDYIAKILLAIVGMFMALSAWAAVLVPKMRVAWKGGNRAPLSRLSRIVVAVGITAWCLTLSGFHPLIWAALFAICAALAMIQSRRDRARHDTARAIMRREIPPYNLRQAWPVLCVIDGLVLAASLFAVVRDIHYPPMNQDQRIIQMMGIGYLVAAALGALYLYIKRPRKNVTE